MCVCVCCCYCWYYCIAATHIATTAATVAATNVSSDFVFVRVSDGGVVFDVSTAVSLAVYIHHRDSNLSLCL